MREEIQSKRVRGSDLATICGYKDTGLLGGVPVLSSTTVLAADPLSPVGGMMEPPWIGLAPACPIGLGSGDLSGLVDPLLLLSCLTLPENYQGALMS